MYTGYKGNTSINKSMSSVNTRVLGGESQLETLQREVDNYTRKLEQEKRRYASTQDTYEAVWEAPYSGQEGIRGRERKAG